MTTDDNGVILYNSEIMKNWRNIMTSKRKLIEKLKNSSKKITLYRAIAVYAEFEEDEMGLKNVETLDIDNNNIGESWTYNIESAKAYYDESPYSNMAVILVTKITLDDPRIDWDETAIRHSVTDNKDEYELNLKFGSQINYDVLEFWSQDIIFENQNGII